MLSYLTKGTKSYGGINLKIDENGYLYITGSNTYTSYITLLSFTMVANQAYTIDETGCTNDLKISWANVNTFTSDAHRTYTPTADTETAIQLIIPANTNYNNYKMKIFLYEGSYDSGKKLEPYTGGIASPNPNYEQPIKSAGDNENLFDINSATNGYINTNGAVSPNNDWKISQYIEVKNNSSYTMSRSNGARQSFVIAEYDENKTFIKRNEQGLQPIGVNSPYTIKTDAITKYIRINYNNTFQATTIKLEKGNKASGFSPYGMGSINEKITNSDETKEQDYSIFVQQPFRRIGDVRDKFVKVNGNWFERHYVLRKIFTGTENLIYLDNHGNYYRYYILNFQNGTGIRPVLSNYFIDRGNQAFGEYNFIQLTRNDFYLQIENITTLADLKTWLSEQYANGKPVYVDYLLAEPLDLPCTEEQVEQLENKPSTYKDFTIIQSEDETEAYLEVSGIYDLNKLINN